MHWKGVPSPTTPNYKGKVSSLSEFSDYLPLSLGAKNHRTVNYLDINLYITIKDVYIHSQLHMIVPDFTEFQG